MSQEVSQLRDSNASLCDLLTIGDSVEYQPYPSKHRRQNILQLNKNVSLKVTFVPKHKITPVEVKRPYF